jgi:hypothetical protein
VIGICCARARIGPPALFSSYCRGSFAAGARAAVEIGTPKVHVSNKSNGSIASGATSHPHNLKVVHPQATYHQAWQPIGNRTGGDRELSDMAQLALQCPHCRAEKIGFAPRGAVPVRPGEPNCLLFLQCQGCGQAIVAVMQNDALGVNVWAQDAAGSPGLLLHTYPESQALAAPRDVPPNVAAAFLSGLDNLGRKGGANAAGAMFRRSIELAARAIDQEAPGPC